MTSMTVTPEATDEELLLGLLNSTPMVSGTERDELDETVAWRSWLASRGDATESEGREALTAVRSALQAVVRDEKPASALKPFLRGIRLTPSMAAAGVEWELDGPARSLVAARAVLAWDLVLRTRPGRLRPCANPDCRRFLLDRSKANTGRWCSMQTCGNRMKARRHYESHSQKS